ncbi:hypothetical protein OE09_2859 [Flavobacteriaceae bacterium MAR_2010_72]|nr:hypothetical protein OE09_2859 [Flavobacteriaceae bacterium MAR_2010_72]TVZ58448.1 hypothetical protein NA63_0948 [Flavobacteriaceae bacterium MAR_2010_105]
MKKKSIAIFFTIVFMAIITTPTIISAIDKSVDISVFYSMSEEEESHKVPNKLFETLFTKPNPVNYYLSSTAVDNSLGYYFKNYPKPHLNLISPPPETHIL